MRWPRRNTGRSRAQELEKFLLNRPGLPASAEGESDPPDDVPAWMRQQRQSTGRNVPAASDAGRAPLH